MDESTGFAVIDPARRESIYVDSVVSDTQFQGLPMRDQSGVFNSRGSMYRTKSIHEKSMISGAPEYADRPSMLEKYDRPSVVEVYVEPE